VPGHAPAQSKNEADRSRATKTGQIDQPATRPTKSNYAVSSATVKWSLVKAAIQAHPRVRRASVLIFV